MIYLVFLLIASAAALYLFYSDYSDGRIPTKEQAGQRDLIKLRERQSAIKLSLSDLDYELSVGKLEKADYDRIQSELLTEWEILEEQAKSYKKESSTNSQPQSCPSCGVALIANAKFCHNCGYKLLQWILAFFLFAGFFHSTASALDIRVTVRNSTASKIHEEPLKIQLLKLEKGMQPVASKISRLGKAEFLGVPESTAGPYMVQTEYKAVTYSKVIPPTAPSPVDTILEIFETTAIPDRLRVRTLVELRRIAADKLAGTLILFFINDNNRTYVGNGGIDFFLPEKATLDQVSVSVGSGASNIQWLKVQAEKVGGIYRVRQSVKPGERILQAAFQIPYNDQGTELMFRALYPQDTGLQLLVEPEDIEVRRAGSLLARIKDPNLGRGLISFAAAEKEIRLTLAKGGIAPPLADEGEAELTLRSPLSTWQKLIFPVLAVLLFLVAFWLREKLRIARTE